MQSPRDERKPAPWSTVACARLLVLWHAKLFGISGAMVLFFAGYFWALRNPLFDVTTMPLTPVDRWIAFRPEALAIYISLWVYVSLAPALLATWRGLVSFGVASAALAATGLAIFVLWPTAVPRAGVDWSEHPAFTFLHSVDASGNACPSLHVAFAVLAAWSIAHTLTQLGAGLTARRLNWLWCAGILYSTVATRQHVFLDVLAGGALGTLAGVLLVRRLRVMREDR